MPLKDDGTSVRGCAGGRVDVVADPDEGVEADGTIRTGARRDRVPRLFEPVLAAAVDALSGDASLYLYGSVATGTARPGVSDVDLLSIDLADAGRLSAHLSGLFADRCRAVEIAGARSGDFTGDSDEAYGNGVFLRHYCVHLAGPDRARDLPRFPADQRAARGFNGDIDDHLRRWRGQLDSDPASAGAIGVRAARKSLLAVAGMVSVHDGTWTTDRSVAVRRWSEIEPEVAPALAQLQAWAGGALHPGRDAVERALGDAGIVPLIVARFSSLVGLWDVPRADR